MMCTAMFIIWVDYVQLLALGSNEEDWFRVNKIASEASNISPLQELAKFAAQRQFFSSLHEKKASTEKMEFTTVMPTENSRKLSSQIFDFSNFVTEIFHHKVM